MSKELFEDLNAYFAQIQHWRVQSRIPRGIREEAAVLQKRLREFVAAAAAPRAPAGEDQFSDEVVEDDC